MKKEDFVARYILASVGLTTTENAIKAAEAAWAIYTAWLPPVHITPSKLMKGGRP